MNQRLKDLGSRIRQVRKERHLSQNELAEMLQISPSHMSDIENGKKNIGIDIFMRITEALQISADWLLRTDIPNVNVIQNQEAYEILSDCSTTEVQAILEMMRHFKAALKNNDK